MHKKHKDTFYRGWNNLIADKNVSLKDWSIAIDKFKIKNNIIAILDFKEDPYFFLKENHLPVYKRLIIRLEDFLSNYTNYFTLLNSDKCYLSCYSSKNSILMPIRIKDIDKKDILAFIKKNIKSKEVVEYNILIQEYYNNIYSDNCIIYTNGRVIVEVVYGDQRKLDYWEVNPDFIIEYNPYLNNFKYSFENSKLRILLYNTIMKIPHSGVERNLKFIPWYYAFSLVKKTNESPIEPIFFDYHKYS